ncbi:hypothetical protein [Polyangium spumosum]|uniref:Uncharacterized protein n=1 Tax=Polyangium spumosum TaxID=889282 RepID=A0A6N7Q717_9BACT|nr:hypothetical protein [Polyangium spumosum]MRG96681.1 hypothetical protein [Polyangium spumosum]
MNRLAPTLVGLALLTFLVFLVAVFPIWPIAGMFVETGPERIELTLWITIGLTALWPMLWYGAIRRPRNGQTTAFQPIRLVGVRRRWRSGDIRHVTLAFTNDACRANFVERNPALLRAGVVRVR